MTRLVAGVAALWITAALPAAAQQDTNGKRQKLRLRAEVRSRYDVRQGAGFGSQPDSDAMLLRSRLGLIYAPVSWLRVSGTVQDSRAPLYGPNAPASLRDSADLYESYFEIFPGRQHGLGFSAGRAELRYGEGRLLSTSSWGNVPRPFDHARVWYGLPKARFEVLFVSPVKIRTGEFNRPALGERVWGTYNSFPAVYRDILLEVYALRKQQNRPGGFTGGATAAGTDRLTVDTFGFHAAGRLVRGANFAADGAVQTGRIAAARHRAAGWVSSVSRRWTVAGKALDLLGEYKYASGTADPNAPARTGTFDQLYPSNHDRFGHQDLFGWRNIHNLRSLATLAIARNLGVNLMYNELWLASARDALYNGAGAPIARSPGGAAGRHVGREFDLFAAYRFKRTAFGAGYGYLFKGGFIRAATPGVNPGYVYCFQSLVY
jgi:hypothetical protein